MLPKKNSNISCTWIVQRISTKTCSRCIRTIIIGLMYIHWRIHLLIVTASSVLISVDLGNVGVIELLLVGFFGLEVLLLLALLGDNLLSAGVDAEAGAARFGW